MTSISSIGLELAENRTELGASHTPTTIEATDRLETLGRFAGGLAHSLNNIFAVILSNAQFGLRELDGDHALVEDLEDIVTAARRGVDLVDELRSVGARQALRPQEFDLHELLEEMREGLEQAAGQQVEVELSLAEGSAPLRADRKRIERAMLTLVENARDSMPDGGELSISTRRARRPGSAEGDGAQGITISFGDTSRLSSEALARAFDPFFPAERQVKPNMALAAAFGIATQSGGTMQAERDADGQTVIRLWLPSGRGE